jgi:hypothetical protein
VKGIDMPQTATIGELTHPRPETCDVGESTRNLARNRAPYQELRPFRRPALDETVVLEYAPATIGVVGRPTPVDLGRPTERVSLLGALGGTRAHVRPGRGRHCRAGRLQVWATAIRKAVTL